MPLESINEDRMDVFSEFLDTDRSCCFTTSRTSDFTDLAVAIRDVEPANRLRVLTDDETVNELRRQFLTASYIVDAVDEGSLEIRTQDSHLPSFLLTGTELTAITGIDDSLLAVFRSSETPFVEETYEEVERRFDAGSPVQLRAPAYSRMLEELGESLGESVQADVESMLEYAVETRDRESDIDAVRLSIVAGAKNEVQLYELSRWGEDTHVGSRSKFSREKNKLEDLGVIDTESINTGVGRPRQRLVLDDDITETSVEDLVSLTESVLG